MSLAEKLSGITKNLEEEKLSAKKQVEDKELTPVRNKIAELEELRNKLDLIKGSLELKSGDKIDDRMSGEGMKEYLDKTKKETQKESTKIDTAIEANKEALGKMGIENRDQLVENPEFNEEEEVVSYKKAKKQEEGLEMSDQALQKRLTSLGVNIEGDFSYDMAEKSITEKMKMIDDELSQEKLKTPEGKDESIEMISNLIKDSLPSAFFAFDEKIQGYRVSISPPNSYNKEDIIIRGDKASFERWYSAGLIPKNIDELEKKYGREIVKSAIKKVYEDKVEKDLRDFDDKNEKNYSLKKKLEKDSPEKGMEAKNAFKEFSNLQNEFRNTIQQKSEELKKKGIEFSPTYPSGFGGNYEVLMQSGYDDIGEIARGLNETSIFPPRFDYEKLQLAIKKQSENLKGLIASVNNINTEEDVKKFLYGTSNSNSRLNSVIATFHRSMLESQIKPYDFNSSFRKEIDQAHNFGKKDSPTQKLISSGIRTFDEAERHLNQKIGLLENMKKIVLEKINTAVEAKLKQKELEEEIQKNNFGTRSNIDSEISRIEQNKKDALEVMSNLAKIEVDLPQEELVLEGGLIMIPSVKKEIDELTNVNKEEGEKLNTIKNRNISHKNKAPSKVLGVTVGEGQWNKEQAEKKEQTDLEIKIQETNDKISRLSNKWYYNISTKQYSDVEKLVKDQKNIKGKPDEILKELRVKLSEVIGQKVPESILKLSSEYKELEAKLK